ncbi:hypothetical protein EWZ63_01735 [Helicobacter pylori]|nr:hypothetical protein [Helicobacter pylori]
MRNYRSLTQAFYFDGKNTQKHFLDFMTNIQNRSNILNPYKDQQIAPKNTILPIKTLINMRLVSLKATIKNALT